MAEVWQENKMFSFVEIPETKNMKYSLRIWTKNFKMIRVISSFADGPVNFNPTPGPVEDQTQKLISRTEVS